MERFFYQNSIIDFLTDSEDTILGVLAKNNSFDLVDLQRNAWLYEISFLKNLLRDEKTGQIIFEYSIPRLGKRIDVILLLHGWITMGCHAGLCRHSRVMLLPMASRPCEVRVTSAPAGQNVI